LTSPSPGFFSFLFVAPPAKRPEFVARGTFCLELRQVSGGVASVLCCQCYTLQSSRDAPEPVVRVLYTSPLPPLILSFLSTCRPPSSQLLLQKCASLMYLFFPARTDFALRHLRCGFLLCSPVQKKVSVPPHCTFPKSPPRGDFPNHDSLPPPPPSVGMVISLMTDPPNTDAIPRGWTLLFPRPNWRGGPPPRLRVHSPSPQRKFSVPVNQNAMIPPHNKTGALIFPSKMAVMIFSGVFIFPHC